MLGENIDLAKLDLASLGIVQSAAEQGEVQADEGADESSQSEPAVPTALEQNNAETAEAEPAQQPKSKGRGLLLTALIAGLLILALLLTSLVAGSYFFGRKAQERAALAAAQQYIVSLGFEEQLSAEFKDGNIVFSGTLPDAQAFSAFIDGMPALSVGTVYDIAREDSIEYALARAFAVHGAAVRAKLSPEGSSVSLSGYVKDPYVANALLQQILPMFNEIPELRLNFHYAEELEPLLSELLSRHQLDLELSFGDTAVFYDGPMTYEEVLHFAELKKEAEQALHCPLQLIDKKFEHPELFTQLNARNTVTALGQASSQGQSLGETAAQSPGAAEASGQGTQNRFNPQDVVGVTMQPLKFITLRDGRKYFEGALLPGGSVLKEVTIDYLIVNYHGREYRYELN